MALGLVHGIRFHRQNTGQRLLRVRANDLGSMRPVPPFVHLIFHRAAPTAGLGVREPILTSAVGAAIF